MKKTNKKSKSIKNYFTFIFVIFGSLSLILLVVLLAIGIPFAITDNTYLLIALTIVLPIIVVLFIAAAFFITRSNYRLFFHNLYKKTSDNIEAMTTDKRELSRYDDYKIQEFEDLNEKINRLEIHNASLEVASRQFDYSKIPLEYLNKKNHLINEESFKKYIREIIYCSRYLRNGIISITYEGNIELDNKRLEEIISDINHLLDFKGVLIAKKSTECGLFVYLPAVESLSFLKATLENLLQKITLSKKTLNGIELSSPKIDAVVYPISSINDIFSDLSYSERQDDRLNIYLPNRLINSKNNELFQASTNVNNVYRLIASLANIEVNGKDFETFLTQISNPIKYVALYYTFDQAGLIMYDKDKRKYGGSLAFNFDESSPIVFNKNKSVPNEFIEGVFSAVDKDFSFFFSKRKYLVGDVSKQLGIYNISSGYFYQVKDSEGENVGLIYFFNTNRREIPLDSYLQSSLTMFSSMLTGLIRNTLVEENVIAMKEREQNLLKLTNIRSYVIDRKTFEVKSFSPSLKRDIPDLEVGQICYKTMFGLEKPCATCPLFSKQKAIKNIRGNEYEVSSVLNNKISSLTELTLSGVNASAKETNRFDKDYLINTYYSFIERLDDLYSVKARGYVALLKIDNTMELVDALGSEGYASIIRNLTKEINDKVLKNDEIYAYKNNTFAVIFSQLGKLDAITAIENISNIVERKIVIDDKEYFLKATYDLTKYPQEHSNSNDFVRHLESLCSRHYENEDNMLYVEESDFTRPASKEKYILGIINVATAAKNFIIRCQPIMNGGSKSVFGSELLIRLSDEYYNSLLNTEEVIAIAAKYNKLYNISDILIDYVGNLYKQYGISIFKPAGFTRMSINADYNYFKDSYSITKILEAMNKYHLPKEFLTFEVTENEIASHYDAFKTIVPTLRRNDIDIVCDRYYGDNLSFAKLKEIGITEIKTDRSIISNIDTNNDKFRALSKLLENGDSLKMNMTLVGVENGEQYNLIKGTNIRCNLQGYYFHHPLSDKELIEAIRTDNVM